MTLYVIREVLSSEIAQAVEVIRQGFGTVAKDFGLTRENCPTNGAFIDKEKLLNQKDKGKFMYGMFVGGRMVGFIQLSKKHDNRYEIEKLTVLPQHRHKGYGKILLDFAKEKAKEFGVEKVFIGIIEENKTLKDWYLKNGFNHTGTAEFEALPFTVGYLEADIE